MEGKLLLLLLLLLLLPAAGFAPRPDAAPVRLSTGLTNRVGILGGFSTVRHLPRAEAFEFPGTACRGLTAK
jgi:hypothetical protein